MDELPSLRQLGEQWPPQDGDLINGWDWWRKLTRPSGPLFQACCQAVAEGEADGALTWWLEQLTDPANLTFITDAREREDGRRRALALVRSAQVAIDHGAWTSRTLPADALAPLADESTLHLGLLVDLGQTLLGGDVRPATGRCSLPLLGVDRHDNGAVLTLTLERVPRLRDGPPKMFAHPNMLFVYLEPRFAKALSKAWHAAEALVPWPQGHREDVRWSLAQPGAGYCPPILKGASASAAFALGLARLALDSAEAPREDLAARIAALDLRRVSITAAVDDRGRLGPVGGIWEKLLAGAERATAMGLLGTVVVAEAQEDVPDQLLAEDAVPLRVLKVSHLDEAVDAIYRDHGPRLAVRKHERRDCRELDLLLLNKAVRIESLYQELPLLREVKTEQLPGEDGNGTEDREWGGLRAADIRRWEEAVSHLRSSYERVSVQDVLDRFRFLAEGPTSGVPRFVVVGPPGSGKTTLAQFLSWRAGSGELEVNGLCPLPVRVQLRDWEARAIEREHPKRSLPEYLAYVYKDKEVDPAPDARRWRLWLRGGEVLLLLDGLDEIGDNADFPEALKTALGVFTKCPTVITCRTVSWQQHSNLLPDFPVFTLAGLDKERRDTYIRGYPANHPAAPGGAATPTGSGHQGHFDPEGLIRQLDRLPLMAPLAANPLLLSLICFVVDDSEKVALPATRGEPYEQAVDRLLARRKRGDSPYRHVSEPSRGTKRSILERAALALFAGMEARGLSFSERDLLAALKRAVAEEGYNTAVAERADALLKDFRNSGLLRGSADQGYFFLHLTLQEFLAASALAQVANGREGWAGTVAVGNLEVTVDHLADRKAWDPAWQEVLTLLAGRLDNPVPLIQLLEEEEHDDVFRHRLALAALCLPEMPEHIRGEHAELVDRIITTAFSLWWEHERADFSAAGLHLRSALPALGEVNGRVAGQPLLSLIADRLGGSDGGVRRAAAEALGRLGPIAATPEMLDRLAELLQDPESWVRRPAADAVGHLGPAAATQEMLGRLAELLWDPEEFVREDAAYVVGRFGPAAATPDIQGRLAELLEDPDWAPRFTAMAAVAKLTANRFRIVASPTGSLEARRVEDLAALG